MVTILMRFTGTGICKGCTLRVAMVREASFGSLSSNERTWEPSSMSLMATVTCSQLITLSLCLSLAFKEPSVTALQRAIIVTVDCLSRAGRDHIVSSLAAELVQLRTAMAVKGSPQNTI